jgi:FlaA1/EpsC-like NDP-sugar epimerase
MSNPEQLVSHTLAKPAVQQCDGPAESRTIKVKLAEWLITFRLPLLMLGHIGLFTVAYWLAFCLRFDFDIPHHYVYRFLVTLPVLLAIKLIVFLAIKSFHGWWRYVTLADMVSIVRALLLSFAAIAVINHFILPPIQIPRAVLILDFLLSVALLCGARSSWRVAREGIWPGIRVTAGCKPALMITNHHESLIVAHQINARPGSLYKIVGILIDDRRKIGSTRAGIPIIGTPEEAPRITQRYGTDEVWVVAGDIEGKRLQALKQLYDASDVRIKVIPSALDSENGHGQIPIRDIDINDLLQREPVKLDETNIAAQLQGARILVTGAGGSIGSEICRQIMRYQPAELVLVDHRENSVFLIHNELSQLRKDGTSLRPAVGDILDEARMRSLFETYRPEYVYHAAAHKHVGLMELNPGEAIKNNVFGTKAVADLAHEYSVNKFVLISTDKAVNPTSVMGATKQIAERYVHALAQDSDTAFLVVRFGNVLGSSGSVVPIFREQITRGGPITVTDPRMTRFFMSIPEASQLVLQAAAMGKGGEIFVLEMGEQVPIIELARHMIKLAGLPASAIEIEFTGARPGEKLYEELYFEDEKMLETAHPKVRAAFHRPYGVSEVLASIEQLRTVMSGSSDSIYQKLREIVPEFNRNSDTTASPDRMSFLSEAGVLNA